MANQVGPGTMGGGGGGAPESGQLASSQSSAGDIAAAAPGTLPDPGHNQAAFHGRPVSWVAVSLIMAGFVVGGLGLVLGPVWVVFWIGAALSVVGGLLAMATDIFEDWY